MDISDDMTPEEVIQNTLPTLPEGAYVTSAFVALVFIIPAEEDRDKRGPFLMWKCDEDTGRWEHLGMLEAAANDMRHMLLFHRDDPDD